MSTNGTTTSYDDIPYPVYVFPQAHPDRAAVIATLLGLNPPPVERCRVLELGCAAGGNTIPMAVELPEATFVGVDLSQRQIAEGRKWIDELKLTNIELRHQSILDLEPGAEKFDYILAHGVFSWVPPAVQEGILDLCRYSLNDDGVAFISYNTLPGWHIRGTIRDMMRYHGQRFSDARQQVAQARALLDFIVASVKTEKNPYGQFLRSELEYLRQQPDAYLFHDHLEEHNTPMYFYQFVEKVSAHGLRYLADADLMTMESANFPPEVRQVLSRICNDLVQLEQYMDFLRNRTFRQSLLCQAHHEPKYRLSPAILSKFLIGAYVRPKSEHPDLSSAGHEQFQTPTGAIASSCLPIVKSALSILSEEWPRVLPFAELCSRARAKLQNGAPVDESVVKSDEQQLGQALLQFYTTASGIIDLRLRPVSVRNRPGSQPIGYPFARWQAGFTLQVTNLRHESISLTEFGRQVLRRLDGQLPRPTLVRQLATLVESGQLTLKQQGQTIVDPKLIEPLLDRCLDEQLDRFAQQSLLQA